MEEIQIKENIFRIKQMNAIEMLAMRTQINFASFDTAKTLYSTLLELVEVQVNDKWLPVKTKGRDIYYPAGIEHDVEAIETILDTVLEYFKNVFQSSSKLKKTQE